jgi:hypothetical protein
MDNFVSQVLFFLLRFFPELRFPRILRLFRSDRHSCSQGQNRFPGKAWTTIRFFFFFFLSFSFTGKHRQCERFMSFSISFFFLPDLQKNIDNETTTDFVSFCVFCSSHDNLLLWTTTEDTGPPMFLFCTHTHTIFGSSRKESSFFFRTALQNVVVLEGAFRCYWGRSLSVRKKKEVLFKMRSELLVVILHEVSDDAHNHTA